jgi:hypothetical protein
MVNIFSECYSKYNQSPEFQSGMSKMKTKRRDRKIFNLLFCNSRMRMREMGYAEK